MTKSSKNTHIVLHNISLLSGTQSVDWELDVVYQVRWTNIKVLSAFIFSLYPLLCMLFSFVLM